MDTTLLFEIHILSYLLSFNLEIVFSVETVVQKEMKILGDYNVYYSFSKTKDILMKYYNKSDDIKMLMDEFDFRCANSKYIFHKKFPFVTVEGPYRRTRNNVAQRLAKKINARVVGNPPQFMIMSSYFFNDTTELRRAFYSLGVHAAACRAQEFLSTTPVVIAGYWVDQTSFGIAKMFHKLPPRNSALYEWPPELLKPDKVYLINPASSLPPVLYHPYKPMRMYSFREKLLEAMLRFRNPSVTEISSTTNYNDIVAVIIQLMNEYFNTTYTP